MKDLQVRVLALLLAGLGLGAFYYKAVHLQYPIRPAEQAELWTVEARISFNARAGRPIEARLFIPSSPPNFTILGEDFVSRNYGLSTEKQDENRVAYWTVRRGRGEQVLYYRVTLHENRDKPADRTGAKPPFPEVPAYGEPYNSAVFALLEQVRSRSADIVSFTRELLQALNHPAPDENIHLLRRHYDDPEQWVRQVVAILAGARIPARPVSGLEITDGLRRATLKPMLDIYNGQRWVLFDPYTGNAGLPDNFLIWHVGDAPLLSLQGGSGGEVQFAATKNFRELMTVVREQARSSGHSALNWLSLLDLPVQTQNLYRILFMVPLGALLVVLLRNVVGIKTFGTFMPILIALAFRETQLLSGVVLFVMLVGLGLLIRFYLERLKLLLVPRLSAVLIIVIILMAMLSVLSHRLGFDRGVSVALFPMVIIAMTIERMSITWEEHGGNEAILQGLGSLMAAVIGYLAMSQPLLQHVLFVFPELLLVILAITLLIGRYTGYRLTELWRFRSAETFDETLR